MTKRQKAGVLAAGVATTAVVGFGAYLATPEEPDLPKSAQEMVDATKALYEKAEDRGMTLPNTPGIRDVRDGMYEMAPTNGREMELVVSSEGPIENGDDVVLCHQYVEGEPMMFIDNATLLAVDRATYDGVSYASVVFTRNVDGEPFTFMGVIQLNRDGTSVLGGMVPVTDGAVTDADVAIFPVTGLTVAVYTKGDVAKGKIAQIGAGATMEDIGSFEWASGNPYNVSIAADEAVSFALSCVHKSGDDTNIMLVQGYQQYPDTKLALSEPIELTEDRFPALRGFKFDASVAPDRWDLAATGNIMAEGGFVEDGTVFLICPRAGGKGHHVLTLRTDKEFLHPVSHTENVFDGETGGPSCAYAGTATYPIAMVCVTNRNDMTGKMWASMRCYIVQNPNEEIAGQNFFNTRQLQVNDITDISYATMMYPGCMSMTADNIFYLTSYSDWARGPTQAFGGDVVRSTTVGGYNGTVWGFVQKTDGTLWVTHYTPTPVVREALEGEHVDGTAVIGGEIGAKCKASIWRAEDDRYFAPLEEGKTT